MEGFQLHQTVHFITQCVVMRSMVLWSKEVHHNGKVNAVGRIIECDILASVDACGELALVPSLCSLLVRSSVARGLMIFFM